MKDARLTLGATPLKLIETLLCCLRNHLMCRRPSCPFASSPPDTPSFRSSSFMLWKRSSRNMQMLLLGNRMEGKPTAGLMRLQLILASLIVSDRVHALGVSRYTIRRSSHQNFSQSKFGYRLILRCVAIMHLTSCLCLHAGSFSNHSILPFSGS